MKKAKRRILATIMILILCTMQTMTAMATENSDLSTEAVYDLEKVLKEN